MNRILVILRNNEIIKKSSQSFFFRLFGSLFGYVFLILVTKELGAKNWGVIVLCMAILNISNIFARLGVDIYVLKCVSAAKGLLNEIKTVYFSGARIVLLSSSIVSIFLFFSSDLIATSIFNKAYFSLYIKYISLLIPLFSLHCVNEQTLRGMKKISVFSFFQSTSKMMITVILFFIFYYILGIDYNVGVYSYFSALALVFVSSTLFIFYKLRKGIVEKLTKQSVILNSSIPMMMSTSVLLIMSWADTLMLGSFCDESQVGIYNVAVKVALLASFTLASINSISAPKISETYNNNDFPAFYKVVSQTTKTIFYTTIPLVAFIFIFPEFILNFFGKEFLSARFSLFILVFSQLINTMSGSVGVILNMTGKEKVFRNILSIALLINITLNILLIPKFEIEGAAIASATSMIFWNLYSVYYVYKKYNILAFISFSK